MKFGEFLKDKIINISLIIFTVITIEILLIIYNFGTVIKIYIPFSILLAYLIGIIIEFYKKKNFYDNVKNNLEELEQKYLITEIIKIPNFLEGKLFYEKLQEINKSMLEKVNKYKYIQEEYKEYIELWIHEIKIPIATSKLVIENNKNNVTKSIDEEIDKIDDYIEQALFYTRSSVVEKDYMIRKVSLTQIVNSVIKKNKGMLISKKIKVDIHDLNYEIYTDNKWSIFILNQIISNSIKYSKSEDAKIEIFAKELKDKVELYIKDNGIGIKKGEIARVFEKGFTGTNGRLIGKKSTGLGLYLCKKLCNKLNIDIYLNSIENVGTDIKITFPKNSYIEMTDNLTKS